MFIRKYFEKVKINNNPNLLINLVFSFFPISFILGKVLVNTNLILFCCLGIFYLRSKIIKTKFDLSIKIIFLFFLVIFLSTGLSFIKSLYFEGYEYTHLIRLVKSVLFFRFFLMLIIVYLLNEFSILNFKYFFLSAALSSIIVSLDIIYQYIFGFNIIGLEGQGANNAGFFGDELVAGGFIQKFSFFSILLVTFALKNKNSIKYILTIITVCILGVGILLSGNRMPLILFLFGLFLIFLFNVRLKKIITLGFISLLTLLILIISSNGTMKKNYLSYYANAKNILIAMVPHTLKKNLKMSLKTKEQPIKGGYWEKTETGTIWIELRYAPNYQTYQQRIFLTAIDTWKFNKTFGNGVRSFRLDCQKLATPPPELTKEQWEKIIALYEAGKIANATTMLEKILERQVGVPGTPETFMGGHFVPFKKNRLCSTHPHNYYLEILTETGIIGLLTTTIIALTFVVFIVKNFKFIRGNYLEELILLAAIISIILETFPLRSTGSFFSTNNATYLTLIASIVLCHNKLLKINNSR